MFSEIGSFRRPKPGHYAAGRALACPAPCLVIWLDRLDLSLAAPDFQASVRRERRAPYFLNPRDAYLAWPRSAAAIRCKDRIGRWRLRPNCF